jgi:putative transposase
MAGLLGVSRQAIDERAKKEIWPCEIVNKRGDRRFALTALPVDIQKALAEKASLSPTLIPQLAPEAALVVANKVFDIKPQRFGSLYNNDAQGDLRFEISNLKSDLKSDLSWTGENSLSMDVLRDPKVARWAKILQEAEAAPLGWKKRKWVEAVANKYDVSASQIYRKLSDYQKKGLTGLHHTKSNRGCAKNWTTEALDWWIGLVLKREHRKIAKDALYAILREEATRRGWAIGGYESALWWLKKRITPQLLALQNGGARALDNLLPPVLRDYSDLAPFELLVGDQHRFDFWVMDDETGEVFRPEGYFWQDLRTRCIYGGALDKKYDSYLCGLALRMGLKIFGAFGSIYTDNGRPELSRYIMGIMRDMAAIGLKVDREVDIPLAVDADADEINPCVLLPGTHKLAIVKNAKAKMIEGTFNIVEGILRDHFRVPGYVKRLTASGDEQDIDEIEKERLARSGQLLTFWEFAGVLFKAMDYYNGQKAHRGVLKEWKWRPKPRAATPMECLAACYADGWRPGKVSDEAIDLIFLPRAERIVDRGRVHFRGEIYEHEKLIGLHKEKVELRFDPLDPDWALVFAGQEFICKAGPVTYSSMKNQKLASGKIEEKARRRKGFILEYRALTSKIPDFLEYSKTPEIEKAAALIGKEDRKQLAEQNEVYRERTAEELARDVEMITRFEEEKRPVFSYPTDRHQWCMDQLSLGIELEEKDREFVADYEAKLEPEIRVYWQGYRDTMGITFIMPRAEAQGR